MLLSIHFKLIEIRPIEMQKRVKYVILLIVALTLHIQAINEDSTYTKWLNLKDGDDKIKTAIDLARKLSSTGNDKEAEKYVIEAEQLAYKLKANKFLYDIYNLLGKTKAASFEFDLALKYHEKQLKVALESKDGEKITQSNISIGAIYDHQLNFEKALEYFAIALKTAQASNNKASIADIYGNLVRTYVYQEDYEKASNTQLKALKIFSELNNSEHVASSYNNLGIINIYRKRYKEAIECFEKSLKLRNEIGNQKDIYTSLCNLSETYLILTEFNKASEYGLKALEIANKVENESAQFNVNLLLGRIYIKLHDLNAAEMQLKLAEKILKKISDKTMIASYFQVLAELAEEQKDYKNSLIYYKKYKTLKDSLFSEEKSKQIIRMTNKYESKQKDREITILNKDRALKLAELERKTEKQKEIIIGFTLLIICLGLIVFVILQVNKIKQGKLFYKQILQSQEEERKRIARELHDSIGQDLLFLKRQNEGKNSELIDPIIEEVRTITRNLYPTKLEVLSLQSLIGSMIENAKTNTAIFITYDLADFTVTDTNIKLNLFRIVQEAINNILKHSKATNARVVLKYEKGVISVIIKDDGIGFKLNTSAEQTLGLTSMKERAYIIGSSFKISSDEVGTTLEMHLKYDKN